MPISTTPVLSLSPSLIAASPLNLQDAVQLAEEVGATSLHIDIMDGHFVPNLTYGPSMVKALRTVTDLFFDVHLMVKHPAQWITTFAESGANAITIHAEATSDWSDIISKIKDASCKAGVAINPQTDLTFIPDHTWSNIDRLIIMSVNPGFSGQTFLDVWDKIHQAALLKLRYPHLFVTIDGGVNSHNIARLAQSGIDNVIIGSAFYQAADPLAAWQALKDHQTEIAA